MLRNPKTTICKQVFEILWLAQTLQGNVGLKGVLHTAFWWRIDSRASWSTPAIPLGANKSLPWPLLPMDWV